ncbi:dihydroneopterin aldolase [Nocardioides aurantiacus]|uniref:7,8-dihydroneopterin aldolase n=1 Tax=Nocardioides aurantiacus TaxID=86796 RepID=A0A3N2CPK9_9ACTN|nr:dihydroneopterin aldolase [Nocardioides aurantiacus]ROR89439.1 dihydroneopterin aldolase [Nocardioides aurantiacus]
MSSPSSSPLTSPVGTTRRPVADRLAVRGLRFRGHHGVLDHEKRDGQDFLVDLVLLLDTRPAAQTDDLQDTVDYGSLVEQVRAVVEGDPVDLIETLAQRIADVCLTKPAVVEVEVTVHKPHAPIQATFEDVALTINRSLE